MSITRVLQPHVCCIGNPVAGNPTQFVMYRAARAAGVDWRFFTSQVSVEQFETAFRGIQALGLDGVAVLEPFQAQAIPLLDSVTESALALGRVNVARSDGNSWLGDNTLGAAIARCIEPSLVGTEMPDSKVPSEGMQTHRGSVVVLNEPTIAKVVRLAAHAFSERIVDAGEGAIEPSGAAENADAMSSHMPPLVEPLDRFSQKEKPVEFLILSSVPSTTSLRQIAALAWSDNAGCLVLGSGSEKQLRPLRENLKQRNVNFIEPVELMANQAAADFFFWTGVAPSVELIRESFEEYLQW